MRRVYLFAAIAFGLMSTAFFAKEQISNLCFATARISRIAIDWH